MSYIFTSSTNKWMGFFQLDVETHFRLGFSLKAACTKRTVGSRNKLVKLSSCNQIHYLLKHILQWSICKLTWNTEETAFFFFSVTQLKTTNNKSSSYRHSEQNRRTENRNRGLFTRRHTSWNLDKPRHLAILGKLHNHKILYTHKSTTQKQTTYHTIQKKVKVLIQADPSANNQ